MAISFTSLLLSGGRLVLRTALTQIAGEPTLLALVATRMSKSEGSDFHALSADAQRRWTRLAQESVLALRDLVG